MSVPAAFLGVIIIWSTTPLAIQWSSEGWGYLFGVTARMSLGVLVCAVLILLMRKKFPLHRKAWETYVAAGLGIYCAMTAVYWASQYIPSGLVAVLFGLSPVATAILAAIILREASLTPGKILGAMLALVGLVVIFGANINGLPIAWQGIVAMLISVVAHSASTVFVKRINSGLSAIATTTGGLLIAVPLYLITWFLADGSFPDAIEFRNSTALIYLSVFGTALGFSLYYYILKNMEASRVALIPLITPVAALVIGQILNGELISVDVWYGTMYILMALILHQWGDQLLQSARQVLVPIKRYIQ